MDGYAIREEYKAAGSNYSGTSLNKFNLANQKWEQYYVDNGGLTLHLKGTLDNDIMILENKIKRDKKTVYNKITWQMDDDGNVRQTWHQKVKDSEDSKQNKDQLKLDKASTKPAKKDAAQKISWKVIFDGIYKPIKVKE